ncbi:MAG: UDP-N-acetylmuramoyl-L-alanine--D-glutamate ligase, partial [Candidatus Niyogibacteria bacterium]|nr:UDP-N-acetylmuramoyl-L-alanine--D-glutamate ligase [Candidatus Niyogibacteria bacterium]
MLLMGLGSQGGGEGIMKFFLKAGANLVVTDLRPKSEFKDLLKNFSKKKKVKFVFGRHRKSDFKRADTIIKNPAVPAHSPFLKYAKKIGKQVMSEAKIFFDLVPREKIIGITGTKGKTTTAMLLAHLLKARFKIRIIGNIPNHSPLGALARLKKLPDFFVYELSSFNLEGLGVSPKYAIITNIFPDHLNRYKSFNEYKKVKSNIFKYQKRGDFLWFERKNSF